MERLSFLLDEHVPRIFANVLASRGFDVTSVRERFGQQSVDEAILAESANENSVVVTNDRDFVRLSTECDHGGIVIYTDRTLLIANPLAATEGIAAIDRYYSPDEMRNVVEWLDNWI